MNRILLMLAQCVVAILILGPGESLAASPAAKGNDAAAAPTKTIEPDMSFVIVRSDRNGCEPNCPQWIQAEGKIVAGTPAKLSRLLADPPNRNLPILLNSYGGDISAALAIGRMIRRFHMNTGLGVTGFEFCNPFQDGKCQPSVSNKSFRGSAHEYMAICFSACPLILLGGETRVVGVTSMLGLHQPITISHPYMDRYWETYRMVNGRKVIISKKLVKRTALPSKTSIGITPNLKHELTLYFNEMKAQTKILDEMATASPKEMHRVEQNDAQNLGLSTGIKTLATYTAPDLCQASTPAKNCVLIK
jgi:hypothetical protein